MKRNSRRRATSDRSAKARHRLLARRSGLIEALERRELLAADLVSGWHNSYNPQDVNFDQRVTSSDLLIVINDLLINGSRALPAETATPLSSQSGSAKPQFLDVTNDGRLNASDAMSVINALLTDEVMSITTVITDMNDNPITSVSVGSQFKLVTYAQDIRNPPPANPNFRGVFSAGVQIDFSSTLTTLDVNQTVQFGLTFDLTPQATLQSNRIIGWGASTATTGPGNAPQKLFTVVMTAVQPGTQTFIASFDSTPDHDNNLYVHPDVPLPQDDVYFQGATLEILGQAGFSVTGPTQVETDGDTAFLFTVSLSTALAESATVQYATSDGTATVADNDYLPTSGTLTFAPGQTLAVVTVTVKGDQKVEPDETFTLTLSNPSNNTVLSSPSSAIATIVNDDVLGVLSISASPVQNVPVGTTEAFFTVTLSQPPASTVTVEYATQDNTAVAGIDYVAKSGTLTFNPGTTSQVVPVTIIGSDLADDVDRFFVNLSNPSVNAEIDVAQVQIAILPAVSGVNVSILPGPSQLEGDSGTTPFVFTLQLSAPSSQEVVVAYNTVNGTAQSPADFQHAEGTVTFAPGQTQATVTVLVQGDNVPEGNETFSLAIEAVSGATGTSSATATIVDDDGAPGLIISDAEVAAGSGISTAYFTVTLTGEVTGPVSVGFSTTDGSAVAGQDYLQATGNLSFDAANRTRVIEVTILSSQRPEPDKTFFVVLSSATGGAVINDPQGVGTIITQGLSISDATIVEGNEGTRDAVFTVTLSRLLDQSVTVVYQTVPGGTATALSDYEPVSGTLTFAPGVTSQLVTVQVKGDTEQELNETFRVQLSNANGAPIFNGVGTGTIINDDGRKVNYRLALLDPTTQQEIPLDTQFDVGDEFYLAVFVQDVQILPTGVAQAFIDVIYDEALVNVDTSTLEWGPFFRTPPGAFQRFDFQPGRLNDFGAFGSFLGPPANPGAEQELYRVLFTTTDVGLLNFVGSVNESDLDPDHSTLLYLDVNVEPVPSGLMNPINSISVNVGSNVITVANSSASESAGQMVFTVTRFLPTNETATVVYSTVNGSAIAGSDYVSQTGTLTFTPGGPTTQLVTITLINDGIDEPDEDFTLVLSDSVGAAISASAGKGTILNDDPPVGVSVQNGTAAEGQDLVFNVNLLSPSGKTVTVVYSTVPSGTATPGVDYVPVTGTLTFAPGETQQSVTVPTLSDIQLEAYETFQLVLSNPANAVLASDTATGTIVDVPPAGISGYVYFDMNNNGLKDLNETGVPGVLITATNNSTGQSQSVLTNADGSYAIVGLIPGTYTLTQTQPGFYTDGRDTRFGIDSPLNDQFINIQLDPSEAESGYNFGEQGIRGEFISAFMNRRALFASSAVAGQYGPYINMEGSVLDLRSGDLWVSFDGGWSGLRQIDALFDPAAGFVTMKLYNNALQEVALSAPSPTGAQLIYNGTLGQPYFLRITGSNPSVTVQIAAVPAVNLMLTAGDGDQSSTPAENPPAGSSSETGTGSLPFNRFASAGPMAAVPDAEPLVDGAGDIFAEEEDWLTAALFA